MKYYQPELLYVDAEAEHWPLTEAVRKRLPGVPVEIIQDIRPYLEKLKDARDPIGAGKRILYLAYDKGNAFKPFPESEEYLSCDYYTLHLSEGCDLECSYCILQAYLTNLFLTVYVNLEESLQKLDALLAANPEKFFRIGTGQLADSLSLDHITGLSEKLIPFFAGRKNATLELKTKSNNIERLLGLSSRGRAIVAWSMNADKIQRFEEHKTATLEERLTAAETICTRTDHRVAFHLDPVIDYDGWEPDYESTIENIFTRIPQERIAWISMGCFRFMPKLKPIMEDRFPKTSLPQAEWIRGMDGKMRYFKPRRVEIYRKLTDMIRRRSSAATLYLTMETPEVWNQVFGGEHSKQTVCEMLDQAGRNSSKLMTKAAG